MIHYQLRCAEGHGFDGWFRSSDAFAAQAGSGLVQCPSCGGTKVSRALMAPALGRKGNRRKPAAADQPVRPDPAQPPAPSPAQSVLAQPVLAQSGPAQPTAPAAASPPVAAAMPDELRAMLQKLRAEVETRCEHVGPRFAEEARAIHNGETAARPIYGEATPDQAEALAEDGIEIARIPWVPRADG